MYISMGYHRCQIVHSLDETHITGTNIPTYGNTIQETYIYIYLYIYIFIYIQSNETETCILNMYFLLKKMACVKIGNVMYTFALKRLCNGGTEQLKYFYISFLFKHIFVLRHL